MKSPPIKYRRDFNPRKPFGLIILIILVVLIVWFSLHRRDSQDIREMLEHAQSEERYVAPGKEELDRAEKLFRCMLHGESLRVLRKRWAALDFNLRKIREGDTDFVVLSETRSHRTGRGFYLFPWPPLPDTKILLQLPHSFKDLYTGNIGLQLALEEPFTAIAWNTVPRYFTQNSKRVEADMSDLFDTYLAAFTRAFAGHYPDGYVIQLHGHDQHNRTTRDGAASDIIISNGTRSPDPWLRDMDRCLEQEFSATVSVYPLEVQELGATETSIGIILRQLEHYGFLHVEMSRSIRRMMRDDPGARRQFLRCVTEN